jgi:hypothetical protein
LFLFLIKADPNKTSFDIGSPSIEDLTAGDIEFRMKEYLDMNVPPLEAKKLKVRWKKNLRHNHHFL